MSAILRRLSLATSILLLPVALLTFASGFFPYKPVIGGFATHDEQRPDNGAHALPAPFDRVIFMVVDALRSDFVYGHDSGFSFTQSLIRSGAAIPFTAHATPPTVTMPRVKALTTGSVPSFLDLILNFAESDTSSSLASQDTWLAQLRARKDGKLVFYGDDTWLKLFPDEDFFARHDGTSSFFVSDFTEVDNNVTRHLPDELKRSDWNGMIMHYLGLDHIGHKTGPQGPNMLPKQKEMDGIVKMVFEALESERHHSKTLLVLVGDHGMNAGGNHGGSGPGETEPALLFASPRLTTMQHSQPYECPTLPAQGTDFHFYTKREQSDVVPTLSALLGLPIPKNNLGVVLPELLGLWNAKTQPQLLLQNVAQILTIIESTHDKDSFNEDLAAYEASSKNTLPNCDGATNDRQILACKLAIARRSLGSDVEKHTRALYDFLYSAQESLSSTASSFNLRNMAIGIGGTLISLVLALLAYPSLWTSGFSAVFLGLTSVLYGIIMFASSYVEEEQHLWYWLTSAWLALLAFRLTRKNSTGIKTNTSYLWRVVACFGLIALHRLSIRWNQTGQKHAGEPDIVQTFFPAHHELMWLLVLASYTLNGYRIFSDSFSGLIYETLAAPWALILVMMGIVFKLNFTQADAPELVQNLAAQLRVWTASITLIDQARIIFVVLSNTASVVFLLAVRKSETKPDPTNPEPTQAPVQLSDKPVVENDLGRRLQPFLTMFLMMQTRAPNVPLFLLMDLQANLLKTALDALHNTATPRSAENNITKGKMLDAAISVLLLSHSSFFFFGGSNSISSLDLSNAYNGIADYDIIGVGILLFASNWAGPIWWSITGMTVLMQPKAASLSKLQEVKAGAREWVQREHDKLHSDAVASVATSDPPISEVATGRRYSLHTYVAVMTIFFSIACVAVMAACTVLRTHLFVWTVFSPKYLYTMAWSIGWHVLINGGLAGFFRLLSMVEV